MTCTYTIYIPSTIHIGVLIDFRFNLVGTLQYCTLYTCDEFITIKASKGPGTVGT